MACMSIQFFSHAQKQIKNGFTILQFGNIDC